MRSAMRFCALSSLLLLFLFGPAEAQYMKITTDNAVDPGRLKSTGTTVLTITLDTVHDRDGSVQSCNSHTLAAGCGSPSTGGPLNLFSYTLTLIATGGTVTWGTFTPADPDYFPLGADLVSSTQTEINRFKNGTFTPPGLVTLGSIPVAPVSGSPRIDIARGIQTINPFGFGTGFGTQCDGFIAPNTYVLGDPAFVCASGDWFDVDGVAAPDGPVDPPGNENRCPVSLPGGPYAGLVGVPVEFDGTASLDPDGNPLTYSWDFDVRDGVGVDATGPTPSHTYSSQNTYRVTLTVADNASPPCSHTATAFANVMDLCPVTLFNGYEPIRVGTGRAWHAFVQPASGCYVNSEVVLSSFLMWVEGRTIYAEARKTFLDRDSNGDGIQEIRATFANDDLQALFHGRRSGTYLALLEANLTNGGKIRGVKYVEVVQQHGLFGTASISPNPMNPFSTLTYATSRSGFARIEMFDVQGRLVRILVDEPAMAAGTHETRIDGRGQRGESLPSGVYFIRGTFTEGGFKKLVTILK